MADARLAWRPATGLAAMIRKKTVAQQRPVLE